MLLDTRTKLLILVITSVSVFMNESMLIECAFTFIPFLMLLQAKQFRLAFKNGTAFIILPVIPFVIVPHLPITVGGIVYMFTVYIRKLIPCFMLGSLLIRTTKVSTFFGGNQPLASTERFYDCIINYTALFSDDDGGMGLY